MNFLNKRPYFVLLLPVFFVLHGYTANAKYIEFNHILPLLAQLLVASALLFLLFKVILKNPAKAGMLVLYCFSFYLFFGAIFDFLKAYSPWQFLYKYSVLLCTAFIVAILLFFWLRKMKTVPGKAILFFNLLFIIFIVTDLTTLAFTLPNKTKPDTEISSTSNKQNPLVKPDIYFLLFDEYSSSATLKELYDFDNTALDSFLVQQGFHLIPKSKSNYPLTYFSMASCLNMNYIDWVTPGMDRKRQGFQDCRELIRNNEVVKYLLAAGYEINNQSIFDLQGHPSPVSQRWISTDTKLITEETLLGRLLYEFDWLLGQYAIFRTLFRVNFYESQMNNNDKCIEGVLQAAKEKHTSPQFIYGHFLLPHLPYYKDKHGHQLPDSLVLDVAKEKIDPIPYYLDYLQYANIELKKLISTIKQHNPGAVIVFLSDHGFRTKVPVDDRHLVFSNQNAVYLPSGNYEKFSDSATNVNQFRMLFNALFDQQYPLLPDSCIMIKL